MVHDIFVLQVVSIFAYSFYMQAFLQSFIQFFSEIEFHSVVQFDLVDSSIETHTVKERGRERERDLVSHILRNFSTYFIECGNKKTGRTVQQATCVDCILNA